MLDAALSGAAKEQLAAEVIVEAVELACHPGKAARALTWARAVRALGDDEGGEVAGAPLHGLGSLLDHSYLGGA